MKIEQLPSGSYRIRKMYKGETYTVVTDYKPTQKEALQLMAAELDKVKANDKHLTFKQACERYVDMKRNVLSPKTTKEYSEMPKRLPDWWNRLLISDISQADINKLINQLALTKAPKTVRNYHGFVSAILGTFQPNLKITTTLPQKNKIEPYTPSSDDVKKILAEVSGTMFEIPILLACYGLRRSEICALTPDDLEGDILHINKALVQNPAGDWVIKSTKTSSSTRDIIIPQALADKIRAQGYIYNGNPNSITCKMSKLEKKLDIPHFSLHKLRHYFASQMSSLGVPEADILKLGGWETDHVMKSVYRHSMMDREEQAKREASAKLSASLFS
ncbi:MAG: site-specific integrase [Butyrivibrio sp.]|nr:site-specific integrase [Muribaculum sp.]MCM1553797.1 site-specific integrase [Butyrivibrio sp.]